MLFYCMLNLLIDLTEPFVGFQGVKFDQYGWLCGTMCDWLSLSTFVYTQSISYIASIRRFLLGC